MSLQLDRSRVCSGSGKGLLFRRTVWMGLLAVFCLSTSTAYAQINSSWTNAAGGDWDVGGNWSSASYPDNGQPGGGDTYNATIDLLTGSPYTVGLFVPITIENLTLNSADATLNHTGGTFTANGLISLNAGTYQLNGGTIANSTITQSGGQLLFSGSSSNTLDNTTVNGGLDLTGGFGIATFVNGATYNGDANLDNSSWLRFGGSSGGDPPVAFTLDNGGTINLGGNAALYTLENIDLTLGPTMTVRGQGSIDNWTSQNSSVINQGTITADLAGQTLNIRPIEFINEGLVQTTGGGNLNVINYLQTTGTTRLDGGMLVSTDTLLDLQGGSLEGDGLIEGDVFNNGVLSPGFMDAGTLTIEGNLELGSSSQWLVDLGGTDPGLFDVVSTTGMDAGDLDIDGSLNVGLLGGFTLDFNQTFVFGEIGGDQTGMFLGLNEGDIVGSFGSFNLLLTYSGGDGNDLALNTQFIPEPSTFGLLGLSMALLATRRRRNRAV